MSSFAASFILTTLPAAAFFYLLVRHLIGRNQTLVRGGIAAGLLALLFALAALFLLRRLLPAGVGERLFPLLLIPTVEEISKLVAVRKTDRHVAEDNLHLMVPLGLLVGCTFGYFENLFYLWDQPGTSLLRGISSLPLHMAATGIASLILTYRSSRGRIVTLLALVLATLLHLGHNALWHVGRPLVGMAIVLAWGSLIVCVILYLRIETA